ncbi:MAG: type II/IV secretion system protein [Planctomycetota bacterium]|nr:MAG: type II/IV secretion system protein [Planctomycetota bacterium]
MQMGFVTPFEVREALEKQRRDGQGKLGEVLIQLGHATAKQVSQALAAQHEIPWVDLRKIDVPPEVIELVPKDVAVEHNIVPIAKSGRYLRIAMADPLDFYSLDNLRFILNSEFELVLASKDAVRDAISHHYGEITGLGEVIGDLTAEDVDVRDLDAGLEEGLEGDDAPVIKLVNLIITDAVRKRASDIHIEPFEDRLRVRYRIDGVCVEQDSPPKRLQGPILSRIKIMAKMDMAEKRKPQDGRIKMVIQGREIDFRVSALPARHGESMVLRVLDKEKALVDLSELGFHHTDYERFERLIKRPNGIVLVTGPTGSGKTTTLYAALKRLNRPDVKIITAENPVEYNIDGINQAQVNHKIGYDFARILRAMLRQAPNVILVGEIRDQETANIAIQAALTGHLVFSTLHTNDAPSSVGRLIDMGVKPFLCASAILAILAQRLVRRLCNVCKEPIDPPESLLRAVGLTPADIGDRQLYGPVGCEECNGTGYRGRLGCYELMEMTPELREAVFNNANNLELRELAISSGGMTTLQRDGLRKVLDGLTTIEEVLRITHRQDLVLT